MSRKIKVREKGDRVEIRTGRGRLIQKSREQEGDGKYGKIGKETELRERMKERLSDRAG